MGLEVLYLDKKHLEVGLFVMFLDLLPRIAGCYEKERDQNRPKFGQKVKCLHPIPHAMGLKVKDRHFQSCLMWFEMTHHDSLPECTDRSIRVRHSDARLPHSGAAAVGENNHATRH